MFVTAGSLLLFVCVCVCVFQQHSIFNQFISTWRLDVCYIVFNYLFIEIPTNVCPNFILHIDCLTGSEEKLAFCKSIGADVGINYKTEDFVARVKEETGGQGIIIISCLHYVIIQHSLPLNNLYGTTIVCAFY